MAFRSETIERAELQALHALADPETANRLRLALQPIGDGVASVAGALPSSAIVINRVLGCGLTQPFDPNWIIEANDIYKESGAKRFFLHLHPDARTDGIEAHFAVAGLERTRGWQKFSRGAAEPIEDRQNDLTTRRIGSDLGTDFGRIVCGAFDLGDETLPWIAKVPGAPGFHAFMSFDGDEPVGCGAIYIQDREAWTDFGATAPAMRGRGAQSANLAARVRFALEQGCTTIHTCTGEDVPGDPQHSYNNIKRCGFRETYLRENWALPKP